MTAEGGSGVGPKEITPAKLELPEGIEAQLTPKDSNGSTFNGDQCDFGLNVACRDLILQAGLQHRKRCVSRVINTARGRTLSVPLCLPLLCERHPYSHLQPSLYSQAQQTYAEMSSVVVAPVSQIYEFRSVHGECPELPDDLSIPQFFLDSWHPLRPARPVGSPWVIDDESGKTLDYEQVGAEGTEYRSLLLTSPHRFDRGVTALRRLLKRGGI